MRRSSATCRIELRASAALALAAALPPHQEKERSTLFTVIGVSALSTLALIVYPMVVRLLGFDALQAGAFLGGTQIVMKR